MQAITALINFFMRRASIVRWLLLCMSVAIAALLLLRNPVSYLGIAFLLLGLMLGVSKLDSQSDWHDARAKATGNELYVVCALFAVSSTIMLTAVYSSSFYFVLSALASGLVFLIPLRCDRRMGERAVLPALILIAAMIRLQPLIRYSGLIGVDAWFHSVFPLEIVQQGSVPLGLSYSMFPSMHVGIAAVVLVTGIQDRLVTYLFCSLLATLALVPAYLLARPFMGWRASLIGCTLLSILPGSIQFALAAAPLSVGYFMLPLILWVAYRAPRKVLVMAVLVSFVVSSNALTPLVLLWMALMIYVARRFVHAESGSLAVSRHFLLVTVVLILAYWAYVATWVFNLADTSFQVYWISSNLSGLLSAVVGSSSNVPISIFQNIPMALFYALAMFAVLTGLLVNREARQNGYAVWSMLCAFFAELMTSLHFYVSTYRWISCSQVALAAVSGYGIMRFFRSPRRYVNLVVVFCLIAVVTFASVTSGIAGGWDNGYIRNAQTSRDALTQSELRAGVFALEHTGILETDWYMVYALNPYSEYNLTGPSNVRPFNYADIADNLNEVREPFLIRDYTLSHLIPVRNVVRTQSGGNVYDVVSLTFVAGSELEMVLAQRSCRVYDDSQALIWVNS